MVPYKTNPPTRIKGRDQRNKLKITSIMAYNNEWTCTTCSRKMLQSQQQDHLAGKPHSNRLKQISGAAARAPSNSSSLQPAATAEDPPAAVVSTSVIARNSEGKGKTKNSQRQPTHQSPRTAEAKNKTNRNATRDKTIGISFSSSIQPPPLETDAHPNWGYIGFQQSILTSYVVPQSYDATTAYGYDDYYHYSGGKGDNFGACDKDCGWCGHCMNNVDI